MHDSVKRFFILFLTIGWLVPGRAAAEEITVFAAASLTSAMGAVGQAFEQTEPHTVRFSFAASSTLAKQIENGAPAHLFMSADRAWMDYLDQRGVIAEGTRTDLLGNRLVVIAPLKSAVVLDIKPGIDLLGVLLGGLLAAGDPDHVPAGKYARQAFENLGIWKDVAGRIARVDTVRAALVLVERGECALGVVYATDAAGSSKVKVVGIFPDESHSPIVYPAALVKGRDTPAAHRLLDFLKEPAATSIFKAHGFKIK